MSRRLLLLKLPHEPAAPIAWRRIADGVTLEEGADIAALSRADGAAEDPDERVVAIVPAADVTIDRAGLPGLTAAQAQAAARLLAAENSIAPLDQLHVAVGADREDSEDRLIASVERARIEDWLARTQALGLDPDAIVPASLLLPRPDSGYVRGEILGEAVIRGADSAFADEDALTPLIVRDAPVERIEGDAAESAMLAALAAIPLNLRQGAFARRQRWRIDWPLVRRMTLIGAGIAAATVLLSLLLILKYSIATERVELDTINLARTAVPAGQGDAVTALDDRLAALRGGGAGFGRTAAVIFSVVRASPNVELTLFDFGIDGTTRIAISAPDAAALGAFQKRLETYGFTGTGGAIQQAAGRHQTEMTVRLP